MEVFRQLVYVLFILAVVKFQGLTGSGRLYFGFTVFSNGRNLRHDGDCCGGGGGGQSGGGGGGGDGHCPLPCHLIFRVSIGDGLDRSNSTEQSPSQVPLVTDDQSQLLFPSHDENVINPLVFPFDQWPDCVDVEISIFDISSPTEGDEEEKKEEEKRKEDGEWYLVDTMSLHMASYPPSSFFLPRTLIGRRHGLPSNLTVVARYECDQTPSKAACPSTSSTNMTSDTDVIMDCPTPQTPLTSLVTSQTDSTPSLYSSSWTDTTPLLMTSYGSEMMSTADMTSSTMEMTSIVPETTSQVFTSFEMESSTVLMPTSSPTIEETLVTTSEITVLSTPVFVASSSHSPSSTVTVPSPTPSTFRPTSPPAMMSTMADVTPGPPMTTTEKKDVTDYWPEILGSVFGALLVVAVVGWLLYRRRQKALLSRQEIYTVTPRMVTTLEENGTAGRSDVAMQMAES